MSVDRHDPVSVDCHDPVSVSQWIVCFESVRWQLLLRDHCQYHFQFPVDQFPVNPHCLTQFPVNPHRLTHCLTHDQISGTVHLQAQQKSP